MKKWIRELIGGEWYYNGKWTRKKLDKFRAKERYVTAQQYMKELSEGFENVFKEDNIKPFAKVDSMSVTWSIDKTLKEEITTFKYSYEGNQSIHDLRIKLEKAGFNNLLERGIIKVIIVKDNWIRKLINKVI